MPATSDSEAEANNSGAGNGQGQDPYGVILSGLNSIRSITTINLIANDAITDVPVSGAPRTFIAPAIVEIIHAAVLFAGTRNSASAWSTALRWSRDRVYIGLSVGLSGLGAAFLLYASFTFTDCFRISDKHQCRNLNAWDGQLYQIGIFLISLSITLSALLKREGMSEEDVVKGPKDKGNKDSVSLEADTKSQLLRKLLDAAIKEKTKLKEKSLYLKGVAKDFNITILLDLLNVNTTSVDHHAALYHLTKLLEDSFNQTIKQTDLFPPMLTIKTSDKEGHTKLFAALKGLSIFKEVADSDKLNAENTVESVTGDINNIDKAKEIIFASINLSFFGNTGKAEEGVIKVRRYADPNTHPEINNSHVLQFVSAYDLIKSSL